MNAAEGATPRPLIVGGEALATRIERSSGGGGPQYPQTYEQAKARLVPQLEAAARIVRELPDRQRGPRLILETAVLPNFLATGHFPAPLLDEAGVVSIGTRPSRGLYETNTRTEENAPARTVLLSASDESLGRLIAAIEQGRTQDIRNDVAKLDGIGAPDPSTILRRSTRDPILIDGLTAMEAVLHPAVDSTGHIDPDGQSVVFDKWRAWIEEFGGRVDTDWAREQAGLVFAPTLIPEDRIEDAIAFNPLRTFRTTPRLRPVPHGAMRSLAGLKPAPPGSAALTDQRIAIFDGEPASNVPALSPYVTSTDTTVGAPNAPEAVVHATTVASAALFGNIDMSAGLAEPPAAVDVFRVWPPPTPERPDLDLVWVLDQICRELSTSDYSIVSISVAPEINLEDDGEPHVWSTTLDQLAAEREILFCVAAGNSGDEEQGLNRVQIPADMANGLSIGACDCSGDGWARAGYSCVGPGRPGASVCPLVVGDGGDIAAGTPFVCMIPGGQFGETSGTSLAAPAAARTMAEAAAAIGDKARPDVLRALAVHFAEAHPNLDTKEVGYGRLARSLVPYLNCEPHEATVLYDGTLERGKTISLPLPLPQDILNDLGGKFVRLRWTLAFTTVISPKDPVDYGGSGVEVFFRPNSQRFNMTLTGATDIPVDLRKEADRNLRDHLLSEGRVPSDLPVTRGKKEYAPENERRADGKWEAVIRVDDRMRASGLHEPSVDLHLLTRRAGRMTSSDTPDSLKYVLLASFWAPEGADLYERVLAEAPVLQPLTVTLPVVIGEA